MRYSNRGPRSDGSYRAALAAAFAVVSLAIAGIAAHGPLRSADAAPLPVGQGAVAAATVRVAFSPGVGGDTAEQLVIDAVHGARRQLLIAAYEFTSAPIARAVIDAKRRGVDVQAVMDRTQ
jgi:phosphatidylserine/phosphatidylglycerophosphate/cardiolipin synthase-like enzyme